MAPDSPHCPSPIPPSESLAWRLIQVPAEGEAQDGLSEECVELPDRGGPDGGGAQSPVVGLLHQVHARRGDAVRRGQVLVSIESSVEQSTAEAARFRAQAEGALQLARSKVPGGAGEVTPHERAARRGVRFGAGAR